MMPCYCCPRERIHMNSCAHSFTHSAKFKALRRRAPNDCHSLLFIFCFLKIIYSNYLVNRVHSNMSVLFFSCLSFSVIPACSTEAAPWVCSASWASQCPKEAEDCFLPPKPAPPSCSKPAPRQPQGLGRAHNTAMGRLGEGRGGGG